LSRTAGDDARARLPDARLMLLFTPEAAGTNDPLEALAAALPWIDLVQVRPKPPGASRAPAAAADVERWALPALALCAPAGVPVLVDDRVDVAIALADRGCAGVHLGRDDLPPAAARALLGPGPLIGLSTHSVAEVVAASDEPVDYLGFGPVHATDTKGYARGLGAETCWVASQGAVQPVFAIGGVAPTNAAELARVGRAAVCSAVLAADDPARVARELSLMLGRDA